MRRMRLLKGVIFVILFPGFISSTVQIDNLKGKLTELQISLKRLKTKLLTLSKHLGNLKR